MKTTPAKSAYINLKGLIEFARDGIVSKTLVKNVGGKVGLFCMSNGQSISTHTSSFPAVIHVLRGK